MKTLYTKLFAIQTKWVQVSKDWVNPHFRSKYMTLDNIIETLAPLLAENRLLVTHFIAQQELVTRVVDVESGEYLDSSFGLLATDPQKKGSEVTYAKRYNLSALFNICADEDDDWNSVSQWNNAPISHDVPQIPSKTTKPYITGLQVQTMLMDYKEGKIQVASVESLIEKAQKTYAVPQWAKDKFVEGFNSIKK